MTPPHIPAAFMFSKVKTHTGEDLPDIIKRKKAEVSATGRAFWGYGGTTCHPITQVKPFTASLFTPNQTIPFLMEPIQGDPFTPSSGESSATTYSVDGITWQPLPPGIAVIGSTFALIVDSIQAVSLEIDLSKYCVAVGLSVGKPASQYLSGQVSKGCFVKVSSPRSVLEPDVHHIGFRATIVEPYAVFVR